MIRQQHLGEIQWYLNLLSLTPTQLAAICGTTEDLTHLFTVSPLLFLSFVTLKAPTWKNQRSLYNNHKDEGASLTLMNMQQNLRNCQEHHISTSYGYRAKTFRQVCQTMESKMCKELATFFKEH